jgi:uncharacterized protein YeaO (DUF488 family)
VAQIHRTHWWLPAWYFEGLQVLPRFETQDIHAFAFFLAQLQEGILESKDWIIVESPTKRLEDECDWTKYLSLLGSLRVIEQRTHETQSFFSAEQWTGKSAQYQVKSHQEALVLGMALEPLMNLYAAKGLKVHTEVLNQPALCLWSTLWGDLTPQEKDLYVRLENAIQWSEDACVHFDGIFGLDWNVLLRGIEPYRRSQSKKEYTTKLLSRFGQKLIDHGFLRSRVDHSYLGLAEHRQLDVLCQLSELRMQAKEQKLYEERVLRHFEKQLSHERQEYIQLLLGSIQSLDHVSALVESWTKLHPQKWLRSGGMYYSSVAIFMEWRVRMMNSHEDPLPEELRDSLMVKLCQKTINQEVFQQFEQELYQRKDDVLFMLKKYPRKWLHQQPKRSNENLSEQPLQPNAIHKRPTHNTLHLKKLAADELQQLRIRSPHSYDELKQKYMASLSDAKRNLLLDLRQRMQPEVFEINLKNSLIGFMIENPSIWKSTKAAKSQKMI